MDPQQPALPLQLHGNSFAMSSGHVPKARAGYNEGGGGGGGGGQEAELNQQNMTSSAHVGSRLSPGEQFQRPLEPLVHCHAKGELDIKSRSCSVLTICHSGVIFPWMNPRTTDSEQSGNSAFVYYHLLFKVITECTQCSLGALMGWIHECTFNEHFHHVCIGCLTFAVRLFVAWRHMLQLETHFILHNKLTNRASLTSH